MKAWVTGSGGLIGSEATKFFVSKCFGVVGIDDGIRREASTDLNFKRVESKLKTTYTKLA